MKNIQNHLIWFEMLWQRFPYTYKHILNDISVIVYEFFGQPSYWHTKGFQMGFKSNQFIKWTPLFRMSGEILKVDLAFCAFCLLLLSLTRPRPSARFMFCVLSYIYFILFSFILSFFTWIICVVEKSVYTIRVSFI